MAEIKEITKDTFKSQAEIHILTLDNPLGQRGFLCWRAGTDFNCEIIDIFVEEQKKGFGSELLKMLYKELKSAPPEYIFAFTKKYNAVALKFYKKKGFEIQDTFGNNVLVFKRYET